LGVIWLPIEIARSGVPVGVDYIMPTVIGIVLLVQKWQAVFAMLMC
jgi:hypothetical protein